VFFFSASCWKSSTERLDAFTRLERSRRPPSPVRSSNGPPLPRFSRAGKAAVVPTRAEKLASFMFCCIKMVDEVVEDVKGGVELVKERGWPSP
jgi:hypothetical protein